MSPDEDYLAPIIITGAGRSGTKLLRSIVARAPETITFPREINYIWRHGNINIPTDELTPDHARPEVCAFIRREFSKLANKHHGKHQSIRVVEKTCANTLRLDFVHAVLPEASIIHLVRDGRAVAESARRRWQAPPDIRYLLEKVRWVPATDIPYYALRYLRYQAGRLQGANGSQSSWGPRFQGLDQLVAEKELIEVCGIQWQRCVQAAETALARLPAEHRLTVRYEDLVADPVTVTRQIYQHLNLPFTDEVARFVTDNVHTDNIHKWQERLSDRDLQLLMPHIEAELRTHHYNIQQV